MSDEAQYGEASQQLDARGAHGLAIQIETPAKYLIPLCVLAWALAVFASVYAYFTERETTLRFQSIISELNETKVAAALLERRYIDMETYAVLNGWKVPKDDQHGPLGNIERMKGDAHVMR